MRKLLAVLGGILLCFNISFAKGGIDFAIGASFYGDAMGLPVQAAYRDSLNGWMGLFGSQSGGGFGDDFFLSAGLSADFVPVEFGITTIEPEITALYRIGIIANGPANTAGNLSAYPFIGLGVPINIVYTQNTSVTGAGFMIRLGGKAGYQIMESLEAGLGFDYRINLSGIYIGSIGIFAFGSLTL